MGGNLSAMSPLGNSEGVDVPFSNSPRSRIPVNTNRLQTTQRLGPPSRTSSGLTDVEECERFSPFNLDITSPRVDDEFSPVSTPALSPNPSPRPSPRPSARSGPLFVEECHRPAKVNHQLYGPRSHSAAYSVEAISREKSEIEDSDSDRESDSGRGSSGFDIDYPEHWEEWSSEYGQVNDYWHGFNLPDNRRVFVDRPQSKKNALAKVNGKNGIGTC